MAFKDSFSLRSLRPRVWNLFYESVGRPLDFIFIIFTRDGGKFKQNMAALNNRRRLFLLILLRRRLRIQKYKKGFWVRNILQQRKEKGEYHTLVEEAMLYDKEFFFVVSYDSFQVWRITDLGYTKNNTLACKKRSYWTCRKALRHFKIFGDAFRTIAAIYRLSDTVAGRIIGETCKALWNVMAENVFLSVPSSSKEWLDEGQDFERRWNFPNCVGAIDGKHIIIIVLHEQDLCFLTTRSSTVLSWWHCE